MKLTLKGLRTITGQGASAAFSAQMRDDVEIRSDLPPTTDDQNNNKEIVTRKKGKLRTNSTNVNRNLPVVLLSNIQSFGRSNKNDKSTEMELILNHNNVDIAVFTETWLCHDTSDQLPFNDYVKFHRIRENVLRYSGLMFYDKGSYSTV